jgi:ABC-type glutathione transport system ATPase component
VAEVLARWRRLSQPAALDAAGKLLDEVGLPLQAMDRRPEGLSGGQCQRVGIARALASDPEVLIADEPTSSLDISAQAQILNLLLRLRAERDLALVLISHDLAVIRHMTDTALVMRNGSVVEEGASELIFTSPSHDYTRELVASTPTLGRKVA